MIDHLGYAVMEGEGLVELHMQDQVSPKVSNGTATEMAEAIACVESACR